MGQTTNKHNYKAGHLYEIDGEPCLCIIGSQKETRLGYSACFYTSQESYIKLAHRRDDQNYECYHKMCCGCGDGGNCKPYPFEGVRYFSLPESWDNGAKRKSKRSKKRIELLKSLKTKERPKCRTRALALPADYFRREY